MTNDTTLLVATVRNEGPNILEWVAHHRLCGFDRIQIFHNDSDDNTLRSLRVLKRLGVIELFINRDLEAGSHHRRSYRRASRSTAYAQSDWCMTLDCDEFLHVKVGEGRVQDLIQACPEADAILVNSRTFGSNGHQDLSGELVTERFTRAEPSVDIAKGRKSPVKALARTSAFGRPGINMPRDPKKDEPVYCNGSGLSSEAFEQKNWRSDDPEGRKLAQVNRYALRDVSSFLLKHLTHAENGRETGLEYWRKHNRNEETDLSLAAQAFRLWSEMKKLDEMSEGKLLRIRQNAIRRSREALATSDVEPLRSIILEDATPPLSKPFKLPNPQPIFASVRTENNDAPPVVLKSTATG